MRISFVYSCFLFNIFWQPLEFDFLCSLHLDSSVITSYCPSPKYFTHKEKNNITFLGLVNTLTIFLCFESPLSSKCIQMESVPIFFRIMSTAQRLVDFRGKQIWYFIKSISIWIHDSVICHSETIKWRKAFSDLVTIAIIHICEGHFFFQWVFALFSPPKSYEA